MAGTDLAETLVVGFVNDEQTISQKQIAVSVAAEYPGGVNELYRKLAKEINFVGDEGRVIVGFTIGKKGNMTNVHIIKGVSEAANNEALRVIKSVDTQWLPAKDKDGNPVETTFVMPIVFKAM